MEWLERLTAKRLIAVLVLGAALRYGLPYYHYPVNWYMQWRYPPQGAAPAAGQDILADSERRESGKIEARYRRVLAELEQARADGFDTTALAMKAQTALSLNTKAYRHTAERLLAEVEMSVPHKAVQYIPMGPTEAPGEDIEPDVVAAKPVDQAPAPKKAKKKRARRRAR